MTAAELPTPRRPPSQDAHPGVALVTRHDRVGADRQDRAVLTRRVPGHHLRAGHALRRQSVRWDPDLIRRVLAGLRSLP